MNRSHNPLQTEATVGSSFTLSATGRRAGLTSLVIPAPSLWVGIAIHAGLVVAFPVLLLATGFAHDSERTKAREILQRLTRRLPGRS